MSTSIDQNAAPDPRELERIINAMFRESSPEQYYAGTPLPVKEPSSSGGAVAESNGVDMRHPQTSLRDPHFADKQPVPPSEAGHGISPDASRINQFSPSNPQTLPDTKSTTHGVVPGSVAGSGIAPSFTQQERSFDINDPPTSHADPHLATPGIVPKSLAGSGSSFSSMSPQEWGKASAGSDAAPYTSYPVAPPSLPGLGFTPASWNLTGLQGQPPADPFSFAQSTPSFEEELQRQANALFKDIPAVDQPYDLLQRAARPDFYFAPALSFFPFGQGEHAGTYLGLKERAGLAPPPFDAELIKRDFPILKEHVNGKPIVWLDNAATTQKPQSVIDRISYFYAHENSNIHRAAHELAARATDAYEAARRKVQLFLGAASPNEIVFVRGATEAINLVAKSWGDQHLQKGDEIVVSHLEHHANIVPWQQLAWRKGLTLRVIPVDDSGQVLLDEYGKLLGPKTKLVAFTHVSNALGTVTPAKEIVEMAHRVGARVLVDGAQSVSHMPVNVQWLGCDWFVFSGHKVFGPTGIGVVYGKEQLLNETQPWQGGGNMIADVTFEETKYQPAPSRFEAGTGNIADAVGLGAAIDYVTRLGMEAIHQYESYLLHYATLLMKEVPGLRMIGTAAEKASVLSFVLEGFRTEEVGSALNEEGIAVRAGHHCAQPILRRFGLETTVRPSLAFYNTCADVDRLVATLLKLRQRRPLK